MAITKQSSGELKSRVNTCITKLSDRDTLSMAANELESIARTLPNDSLAPFLNCLSATDSSEKSPVRRQCVRLLGVLSAAHGDALSPHVSRMISTVIRRLHDPDSAVRLACVDAVTSISVHVNSPPFTVILKPLVDALFHEQDSNVQNGASLCLAAVVKAASEPDAPELKKLLPRVLKLVKSDCFKAKPNLLLFIASIVGTGIVKNRNLSNSVISMAIEFLSSEDWAARKAAAEVLAKVATSEQNFTAEFKAPSIAALESKRFDKVKVVRETMNRALETWKCLPDQAGHVSSSKGDDLNCIAIHGTIGEDNQKSSNKCDSKSESEARNDDAVVLDQDQTPKPPKSIPTRSPASTHNPKIITKPNQDNKQRNSKSHSQSRVVPYDNSNDQDLGDLLVIRKQLEQIEKQQSYLLDLLQRFMGSSQKGMNSLERRVDGLEKVVDEMSQDLVSRGGNTCCMIPVPGAEFLSPKFWRRAEGGVNV